MRRRALLLAAGLLAAGLVSAGVAEAAPRFPQVTGGGQVINQRNQAGPPGIAFGGFTARATGPFEEDNPPGISDGFPARGQVQLIGSFDGSGAPKADVRIHGEVVCMWNHGDPKGTAHQGDSDSHADVWELRFRITGTTIPGAIGAYASVYVQDGGKRSTDYIGEAFADAGDGDCGEDLPWDLEPLFRGNASVRS